MSKSITKALSKDAEKNYKNYKENKRYDSDTDTDDIEEKADKALDTADGETPDEEIPEDTLPDDYEDSGLDSADEDRQSRLNRLIRQFNDRINNFNPWFPIYTHQGVNTKTPAMSPEDKQNDIDNTLEFVNLYTDRLQDDLNKLKSNEAFDQFMPTGATDDEKQQIRNKLDTMLNEGNDYQKFLLNYIMADQRARELLGDDVAVGPFSKEKKLNPKYDRFAIRTNGSYTDPSGWQLIKLANPEGKSVYQLAKDDIEKRYPGLLEKGKGKIRLGWNNFKHKYELMPTLSKEETERWKGMSPEERKQDYMDQEAINNVMDQFGGPDKYLEFLDEDEKLKAADRENTISENLLDDNYVMANNPTALGKASINSFLSKYFDMAATDADANNALNTLIQRARHNPSLRAKLTEYTDMAESLLNREDSLDVLDDTDKAYAILNAPRKWYDKNEGKYTSGTPSEYIDYLKGQVEADPEDKKSKAALDKALTMYVQDPATGDSFMPKDLIDKQDFYKKLAKIKYGMNPDEDADSSEFDKYATEDDKKEMESLREEKPYKFGQLHLADVFDTGDDVNYTHPDDVDWETDEEMQDSLNDAIIQTILDKTMPASERQRQLDQLMYTQDEREERGYKKTLSDLIKEWKRKDGKDVSKAMLDAVNEGLLPTEKFNLDNPKDRAKLEEKPYIPRTKIFDLYPKAPEPEPYDEKKHLNSLQKTDFNPAKNDTKNNIMKGLKGKKY